VNAVPISSVAMFIIFDINIPRYLLWIKKVMNYKNSGGREELLSIVHIRF